MQCKFSIHNELKKANNFWKNRVQTLEQALESASRRFKLPIVFHCSAAACLLCGHGSVTDSTFAAYACSVAASRILANI